MTTRRLVIIASLLATTAMTATAQEWMRVHWRWADVPWTVPMRIEQTAGGEFSDDGQQMRTTLDDGERRVTVPLAVESIDSISFADGLSDDEKGHDKYRVFAMHITTLDSAPIAEREVWTDCHIAIDGMGEYSDYSGLGRIRGRGNSTWEWYDKKPYKLKLGSKSKLLGLEKAKNWNLLANYRDPTDLMNAFAFEAARCMGMPHTNHTRFVEVFLNGEYIGLYQLTEKIEAGKNRVDIDEDGGVILSFDKDDGPGLSPGAGDNFFSEVYGLPMCVKHPDEPSPEQIEAIKAGLAELEYAVAERDYAKVDSLMDVESFMHILQLHELLYNVEIDAPRSLYMYRDKGGKYTFGPVWDWDAGYDFDWGDMMTGHTFFTDHRELIYGTDPANHKGAAYTVNPFWTTMFKDETFVARYKELWAAVADTIVEHSWGEMEKYIAGMNKGAIEREARRWPITKPGSWWEPPTAMTAAEETAKMKEWLDRRLAYLNQVIAAYPKGSTAESSGGGGGENGGQTYEFDRDKGVISITHKVDAASGYQQIGHISVSESDVTGYLGSAPTTLRALNADGSHGRNTAAGTYGAWFDADGDTQDFWGYPEVHVYIESNDLYTWAFGSHPQNCEAGHSHTVRMQYANRRKTLDVVVTFIVE